MSVIILLAGASDYNLLFFFNDTATTEIYTLSLHDALPISALEIVVRAVGGIPTLAVLISESNQTAELIGAGGQNRVAPYLIVTHRNAGLGVARIRRDAIVGDAAPQRIVIGAPFETHPLLIAQHGGEGRVVPRAVQKRIAGLLSGAFHDIPAPGHYRAAESRIKVTRVRKLP